MIVDLEEFVEALSRTTKMKRAPAGARSTGLKAGAFVPELTGFRVEMPGGSSLVNAKHGRLDEEVVFEAHRIASIVKVLSTYQSKGVEVTIVVSENEISFQCGSSRLIIPRRR